MLLKFGHKFLTMMYERRIADPDSNGAFNVIHGDEFEFVNPEQKLLEQFLFVNMSLLRQQAYMQIPPALASRMTPDDEKRVMTQILKQANEEATAEINRLRFVTIPEELLAIFTGLRKKDEEKLFKKVTLTPEMFMSLILHAGTLGYTYSLYTYIQNPTGTNGDTVPRFAYKDETDNSVFNTDDTSMSKGQIRALIEQRSTRVVKMLDKGAMWHCFFLTFKGIAGKEKDHPPHMHYLSSSWALTREQALSQLQSKSYSIPSAHVWYDKH